MQLLTDFPDCFSPMLVKDLRRLLKSSLFIRAFIFLHLTLVVVAAVGIAGLFADEPQTLSLLFWGVVIGTCLATLKECNLEKSEDKGKNMELIKVSGLTPWSIIFGKWCSVNALLLLYVTSTLPYIVFRYFSGTCEIVDEILILILSGISLSAVSSIVLGFSSFKSPIVRGLFLLVLIVGLIVFVSLFTGKIWGRPLPSVWPDVIAICILGAFMIVYPLLSGASRLKDSSANYAIKKRLLALGSGLVIVGLALWQGTLVLGSTILIVCFSIAILDGFSEPTPRLKAVLRPFAESVYRKPFAWLLIPGWPTAYLFSLVCIGLCLAEQRFCDSSLRVAALTLFCLSFIVIPLSVAFWFANNTRVPPGVIFITVIVSLITLFFTSLDSHISVFELSDLGGYSFAAIASALLIPFIGAFRWFVTIGRVLKRLEPSN